MALTPDGRAIDTRPSDARPPWAAYATDHDPIVLRSVKPTTWHGSKVSGIDLTSDFVWIDDQPLKVEIDTLQDLNLLSRLIVIDTNKDDDALLRAADAINSLFGNPLAAAAPA